LKELQTRGAGSKNAIGNWIILIVMVAVMYPFFQKTTSGGEYTKNVSIKDQITAYINSSEKTDDLTGISGLYSLSVNPDSAQNTLEPTPTIMTVTPTPIIEPTPLVVYQTVTVKEYAPYIEGLELTRFRYSYYYPPLGGVNCRDFIDGVCQSPMASGDLWEDYLYKAVACDSQYPLGTKFLVVAPEEVKGEYICLDRGGGIEGTDLIDFLDDTQRLPWLDYVYVYILK